MNKRTRYSPEVKERAVRMVFEHQRDQGIRPGQTSAEQDRIKTLERECKELRRANDILRTAAAFFAQAELDRRLK